MQRLSLLVNVKRKRRNISERHKKPNSLKASVYIKSYYNPPFKKQHFTSRQVDI